MVAWGEVRGTQGLPVLRCWAETGSGAPETGSRAPETGSAGNAPCNPPGHPWPSPAWLVHLAPPWWHSSCTHFCGWVVRSKHQHGKQRSESSKHCTWIGRLKAVTGQVSRWPNLSGLAQRSCKDHKRNCSLNWERSEDSSKKVTCCPLLT